MYEISRVVAYNVLPANQERCSDIQFGPRVRFSSNILSRRRKCGVVFHRTLLFSLFLKV